MIIKKIIKNFKIRTKLLFLVSLPVLAFLVFVYINLINIWNVYKRTKNLIPLSRLAQSISDVLHETQRERGASSIFLNSNGNNFSTELQKQRKRTDEKIELFNQFLSQFDRHAYGDKMREELKGMLRRIGNLAGKRNEIDAMNIELFEVINYYTDMNNKFLDVIGLLPETVSDSTFVREIVSYISLLKAKEKMGLERAVGGGIFASRVLKSDSFEKFKKLILIQDVLFDNFVKLSNEKIRKFYKKELKTSVLDKVKQMRSVIFLAKEKIDILSNLTYLAGYTGMIHLFKDYIIRGNDKYALTFLEKYNIFKKNIDKFKKLNHFNSIDIKDFETILETMTQYKKAIVTVAQLKADGLGVMEIDSRIIIDDRKASHAMDRLLKGGEFGIDPSDWFRDISTKIDIFKRIENHLATTFIQSGENKRNDARNSLILMTVFVGGVLIVLVVLGVMFILSMTRPLQKTLEIVQVISHGDFSRRINLDSKDEIGEIGRAIDTSSDELSTLIRDIQKNSEVLEMASRELSSLLSVMLTGTNDMTNKSIGVATASEEMSMNVNSIASAAEEMSLNAGNVSSAAEEMSTSMKSIKISMDSMGQGIQKISGNATEAIRISDEAISLSNIANETMDKLGVVAEEIGKVTDMIKRIAEQTNLLALNATIEAASAGDAGKGFAVVAGEIKELVAQSTQAAEGIAKKIEGVQNNTKNAIIVIGDVSNIIHKISLSTKEIDKEVTGQKETSEDVSRNVYEVEQGAENIEKNIGEVAVGIEDMSKNSGEAAKITTIVDSTIQDVSRTAKTTALGSEKLQIASNKFLQTTGVLKKLVDRFKIVA